MVCSGCVRVYELRQTRPVVFARYAPDLVLVIFDRLGLRPHAEGMSLIGQ